MQKSGLIRRSWGLSSLVNALSERGIFSLLSNSKGNESFKGLASHSKCVEEGDLFLSQAGQYSYVKEAMARGAVAVITRCQLACSIPQLVVPVPNFSEEVLNKLIYRDPSQKLLVFGITGTKGKSTTAFFLRHLLQTQGILSGLMGTIHYDNGRDKREAFLTTPNLSLQNKCMREMVENGCRAAVLEVSSHALDQERVKELSFHLALFTNLSHDHLDYHSTMESYFMAKVKLFEQLSSFPCFDSSLLLSHSAVINGDDAYAKRMLTILPHIPLTYGIENTNVDLGVHFWRQEERGIRGILFYRGTLYPFSSLLIGKHNLYNALAATTLLLSLGIPLASILPFWKELPSVPGRLERFYHPKGVLIYVDFAHSPHALFSVLQSLSLKKRRRLITLFGCGGERDIQKRPIMGKIAAQFSDLLILTSDNSRSESTEEICKQIQEGIPAGFPLIFEEDRLCAIERAIGEAERGDCVLVAGRGHERVLTDQRGIHPFHDPSIIQTLCQ